MDTKPTVEPIEGESYEGRQWGYNVIADGQPILRASTGGTGPCWNIWEITDDQDPGQFHICDLDEFIAALTALRDSDAYRANVDRWTFTGC